MSWLEDNWLWVFWTLLFVLACIEAICPLLEKGAQRQTRWPANVAFGLLNGVLASSLPVFVVMVGHWAEVNRVGVFNMIETPWVLAAVVSFLLRSLAQYSNHALLHKVPVLWRLHRVHHCDTGFDISTALRAHPVEMMVNALLVAPFVIVFGLSPIVLVVYELCEAIANLVTHANLRLPPSLDSTLRLLLVTPAAHIIHHSSYQPETDSNYGVLFTVWDRLFGTYCAEPVQSYGKMQIGLEEISEGQAAGFLLQLQSPWRDYPKIAVDTAAGVKYGEGAC